MSEIDIIYGSPAIFTKDFEWVKSYAKNASTKPGAITLLPSDAVLVVQAPDDSEQISELANTKASQRASKAQS